MAARGAKQSVRTDRSASNGGRGRCAGGTLTLNLARQIGKMATRIDRHFLVTSDALSTILYNKHISQNGEEYEHNQLHTKTMSRLL